MENVQRIISNGRLAADEGKFQLAYFHVALRTELRWPKFADIYSTTQAHIFDRITGEIHRTRPCY